MPSIYFVSDTHFGHTACWQTFKAKKPGTNSSEGSTDPMRPFTSTEEMNETMIANWNRVVQPNDKVYHLGDFAIAKKNIAVAGRLNGDKILVRGNHDIYPLKEYTWYFRDVRGSHKLENYVMTHIPIHPDSVARWCDGNIHGHLHDGFVPHPKWPSKPDPRYYCVSVERIDYTPIEFGELKERFKAQQ